MMARRNTKEIKHYLKAPMVNLPNEIIVVVLLKLPVKSLIQFKCVCKAWRSLISERKFIKMHIDQAIEDVNVGCLRLLVPTSPLLQSIDYESQNNDGDNDATASVVLDFRTICDCWPSALGSCHGLVLLVCHRQIVLFNPSTRVSRTLPKPSTSSDWTAWGLGYDPSIDDYKVVKVNAQVEVFSLRRNSWKIVQDIHMSSGIVLSDTPGVFSNGALHWIGNRILDWIGNWNRRTEQMIVSFDLATEKLQELKLPLPIELDTEVFSICSLNVLADGCILAIRRHIYIEHQVWIMKEYGVEASWTKWFSISEECRPHTSCYLAPVCFSKNGEFLVDIQGRGLKMYSPTAKTYRDIHIRGWSKTIPYVESLVSPND